MTVLIGQGAVMTNYFATFGSGQLEGFKTINPMKTAVTKEGYTEEQLREELRKPPFNNKYCTTYPLIEEFEKMNRKWGVLMYDLDELKAYHD